MSISDEIMKKVPKVEPKEDLLLPSFYDLEYRADEDDAWYSVYIVFDTQAQTLTVKYLCSPAVYEVVIHAGDFETEAQAEQLSQRFRPLSQQLQDHECGKLQTGTTVCAAHGTADDDLRFYDAVIEAVNRQSHSFTGGEEECLCTFVLFWQHGRGRGTLTSANIGSICTLEHVTQLDPRISAFVTLTKEKINSSKSISVFDDLGSAFNGPSSGRKNSNASIEKILESSQNRLLFLNDSGRIRNYTQWRNEDEDIGSEHCYIDGLATAEGQHFILIHNLEKDLTPSSIEKFIYKQTTILPQALVFPRLLSDPFAEGAILVDCQEQVQTIYKFLDNPDHFIVSSRGRPWVVMEKAFAGPCRITAGNLIPTALDKCQHKTTDEEVRLVHSGTESYERAKQLAELFVEFLRHESLVCNKLVLEEKKIWRSFKHCG